MLKYFNMICCQFISKDSSLASRSLRSWDVLGSPLTSDLIRQNCRKPSDTISSLLFKGKTKPNKHPKPKQPHILLRRKMNSFYVPPLIFQFSAIFTVVTKYSYSQHFSFPTSELKELHWHWDMDNTNYSSRIFPTGRLRIFVPFIDFQIIFLGSEFSVNSVLLAGGNKF